MNDRTPTGETGEDHETPPYRIDTVFEGAVEASDHFETFEAANDQFEFSISEFAGNHPDKNWHLDLYREGEPPDLVDSHTHEAEDEYEVTFAVRVHAEDADQAETAAQDLLEQLSGDAFPPANKVEIVTDNRDPLRGDVEYAIANYLAHTTSDAPESPQREEVRALLLLLETFTKCRKAGREDLKERIAHEAFGVSLKASKEDPPAPDQFWSVQVVEGGIPESPEVFRTEEQAIAHWREVVAQVTKEHPDMWEIHDPGINPEDYQYIALGGDDIEVRIL